MKELMMERASDECGEKSWWFGIWYGEDAKWCM